MAPTWLRAAGADGPAATRTVPVGWQQTLATMSDCPLQQSAPLCIFHLIPGAAYLANQRGPDMHSKKYFGSCPGRFLHNGLARSVYVGYMFYFSRNCKIGVCGPSGGDFRGSTAFGALALIWHTPGTASKSADELRFSARLFDCSCGTLHARFLQSLKLIGPRTPGMNSITPGVK